MTLNRVLFAAGGIMLGLIAAQMLGVSSLGAKIGIGSAAA